MQGASAGGSPEREAGADERPRGPGRGRRVRFRMPHTTIVVPSGRDEEQLFYRRLDALGALGPDGFAPLFAAEGWSEVTEDRLLRKRVVRDGQGGAPQPGQEVSVKVLGALEDGGLVERDPRLSFVPGQGDAVQVGSGGSGARGAESPAGTASSPCPQALELGVPTMRGGEICFFLAASPYGYGRAGREPDVPPEAPLVFEVTLLEVRDGPDPQRLPPAARLRLGAQKRERGNVHFARGDFAAALLSYRLALRALEGAGEERRDGAGADRCPASPPGPHEEEELREQRVKCLNNCAAAARRLQRGAEALAAVEAALRLSPDNGTALLRRGQPVHAELARLAKRRARATEEPRDRPRPPQSSGEGAAPPEEPRAEQLRSEQPGPRPAPHGPPPAPSEGAWSQQAPPSQPLGAALRLLAPAPQFPPLSPPPAQQRP
ncbi:peptidyl-prolyl cis-trans isomerase FKBP8-like isoform X3 [Numida meleagris]|uniref:peptidyl-prolyl cis-trans isomerase FKBP8-like isoform X3 n=1 Tax=Numida meleagris TaxID=8996 RepID=UPI000B3E344F|nr:peptidyl-prolyl cis-trans isomerase FKBP8-like isoform X3 [Numida meleagris]